MLDARNIPENVLTQAQEAEYKIWFEGAHPASLSGKKLQADDTYSVRVGYKYRLIFKRVGKPFRTVAFVSREDFETAIFKRRTEMQVLAEPLFWETTPLGVIQLRTQQPVPEPITTPSAEPLVSDAPQPQEPVMQPVVKLIPNDTTREVRSYTQEQRIECVAGYLNQSRMGRQTQAEYCTSVGVPPGSFSNWVLQLEREAWAFILKKELAAEAAKTPSGINLTEVTDAILMIGSEMRQTMQAAFAEIATRMESMENRMFERPTAAAPAPEDEFAGFARFLRLQKLLKEHGA